MSKIKVRVSIESVTKELDTDDYMDKYLEDCEANGDEPEAEPPKSYVIEIYQQQIEDGDEDMAEVFANAAVTVTPA